MICRWCRADVYDEVAGRCRRCGDLVGQPVTRATLRPFSLHPVGDEALAAALQDHMADRLKAMLDLRVVAINDGSIGRAASIMRDAVDSLPSVALPQTVGEMLGLDPDGISHVELSELSSGAPVLHLQSRLVPTTIRITIPGGDLEREPGGSFRVSLVMPDETGET